MIDDIEPSPEDAERWERNLLAPGKNLPTKFSTDEQKMIAKVLGTKTQAEEFFRHETRKPDALKSERIDIRRPFKSRPPIVRFEYWEGGGTSWRWHIERYENGRRIAEPHSGSDWDKRDELLIKLRQAGHSCTPVTVAGVVPTPIKGRVRETRKAPSGRFDIMAKIGKLTTEDLENDK